MQVAYNMPEVLSPAIAAMQEERSGYILLLLAILVLMLHVFGIVWLRQPPVAEQTSSPQPFKLEVTMLSTPAPKIQAYAEKAARRPGEDSKK